MAYLKFSNVAKVYNKKVTAVKDFNLEIKQGEFIVFLGPSGCGKTTTLRMIAGLEEVTAGDIVLDGKSIVDLEPRQRGVSMIFQSYAVWPHMSVYQNLAYALKLQKKSRKEIDKIVKEVAQISSISDYLDRYPDQLSGGQKQRVAVARAIAVKPKLFLLDEPLSNLDAKLRASMRTDLKRIHQELKATSIFVTHDQAEALSLADRIVVMNKGEIEQIGTPFEIYHRPQTLFIAKFIGLPPSNLFNVKIVFRNNKFYLKNDDFEIEYKPNNIKTFKQKHLNTEVIMAIKPEDILLDKKGKIEAKVSIVEPQGSYVILNCSIGKEDVKIVSKVEGESKTKKIKVSFLNNNLSLFDKISKRRID
jgi:multiple sugar transport system ATP-binding protein